jgi:actin-like ATPase involved in cell morphogenesis
MAYRLGVDLGTTFTSAAVAHGGHVEVVALGDHAPQIPSVILKAEDGTLLVGESAARRAADQPERVAREFKRRIGDKTSMLLAGTPMSPHALTGTLLGWVVRHVAAGQGSAPDEVVVTCPANWGPYRRELLEQAVSISGLTGARLCTEPEAAAVHFASTGRLQEGDVIAVYDLGGGTFDAAVLRQETQRFSFLGQPEGIEQLGGLDFDEAVFSSVWRSLGLPDDAYDDPAMLSRLIRLRRECTDAKEALSRETAVSIPVELGGTQTTARMTRAELEELIRPAVEQTVDCLERTVQRAGVRADELAAVVMVGGSARIPLVTEMVTERLARPVALSPHPKLCVAMGAALSEAEGTSAAVPDAASKVTAVSDRPGATPADPQVLGSVTGVSDVETAERMSAQSASNNRGRRLLLLTIGTVAVVAAVVLAIVNLWPSSDPISSDAADASTVNTPPIEPSTASPRGWQSIAPLSAPVDSPGAVDIDGELWVVGGLLPETNGQFSVDTIQIYNPVQKQWRDGPNLRVPIDHAAVTTDGVRLYVIGGQTDADSGEKVVVNTVWMLDEDHESWNELDPLPEARASGAAAWDGRRLVFAGGFTSTSSGPVADDVWVLENPHLEDSQWRELPQSLQTARQHLAVASDGEGQVWFLGGRAGASHLGSVDIVTGDSVRPGADISPVNNAPAAVWDPDMGVCLLGGAPETGLVTAAVTCLDNQSNVPWPPLAEGRAGAGAAIVAGVVYVAGGYAEEFALSDHVQILELG